ncbi:hypothetical protein MICRO8M_10037 [Microbacterium sp. 8M]|nr:hypothetical protein MICRO8M_10037 [Microbacterium sp. 8M]
MPRSGTGPFDKLRDRMLASLRDRAPRQAQGLDATNPGPEARSVQPRSAAGAPAARHPETLPTHVAAVRLEPLLDPFVRLEGGVVGLAVLDGGLGLRPRFRERRLLALLFALLSEHGISSAHPR